MRSVRWRSSMPHCTQGESNGDEASCPKMLARRARTGLEKRRYEFGRIAFDEGRRLRIEVACRAGVDHDLGGLEDLDRLGSALGNGVAPEAHHHVEGRQILGSHDPVVPRDHGRVAVRTQLRKRIGQ